jgi:hypothetical protein
VGQEALVGRHEGAATAEDFQSEGAGSVVAAEKFDVDVGVGELREGEGVVVALDGFREAEGAGLFLGVVVGDGDEDELGAEAIAQFGASGPEEADGFAADVAQARDGDGNFLQGVAILQNRPSGRGGGASIGSLLISNEPIEGHQTRR